MDDDGPDAGTPEREALAAPVPVEAAEPLRGALPLAGTFTAGIAVGAAEVVPGFSGGTVALVVGLYERLVAAVRQGARVLSLLVRGRAREALGALGRLDGGFVGALGAGMVLALLTVAGPLRRLIEERPVELSAVLLGLVLGAALVAGRQLRAPAAWQPPVVLASAAGSFVLLGAAPGTIEDPGLPVLMAGAAVAVCAWILPGVSGSFVLLLLGLWPAVVGALADRDWLVLGVVAAGCVLGLAAFSTLLSWLLRRAHDLVLAVLLGLLVGSSRVLWPWPSDRGIGDARLGAPGDDSLLALALGLAAFSLVWMLGLAAAAVERRLAARGGGAGEPA